MIRGMILDVDGTLLMSNDAHTWSFVRSFAQHGYEIPFERIRPLIGMGGDKLLPALVPGLSSEKGQGKDISETRKEILLHDYAPDLEPTPGARALVQELKRRGIKLAIATSAKQDELEVLLKRAQVDDLVTKKTSSSDVNASKPAPDVVDVAMQELGLDPDEVLMLGDTPYDLESAARAGVKTIAVLTGGWSRDQLAGAAAVYESPLDLLEHLDESPVVAERDSVKGP